MLCVESKFILRVSYLMLSVLSKVTGFFILLVNSIMVKNTCMPCRLNNNSGIR